MQLERQGDGRYIGGVKQPKETEMIYAVNKRTKEHLICGMDIKRPDSQWDFVEADADGWIEWSGGECPLPDECPVKLRFSTGLATKSQNPARWSWLHDGAAMPIIAYRPILDDTPQAPKDCVTVRYDLDPVSVEGAIRDKLIEMGWTPPQSNRERWIEAAKEYFCDDDAAATMEFIYDALKSGDLPQP